METVLAEVRLLRQDIERLEGAKSKTIEVMPKLLPVSLVAKMLGRSKARVYELCLTGEVRSIRDGASVLIPADEPDRWLKMKLRQSN